eukprot:GILI01007374.1.p1 GENE.GILI01007374.1~~GILI01007374.1.p1  ORF type:complete len:284 (-),score=65.78 GILI01007374.1:128-979(-)
MSFGIPKTSGYSGFISAAETVRPTLKPNQSALEQPDFYATASSFAASAPDRPKVSYVGMYKRSDKTVYSKDYSEVANSASYHKPVTNRTLSGTSGAAGLRTTSAGGQLESSASVSAQGTLREEVSRGASHWQTETRASFTPEIAQKAAAQRATKPQWLQEHWKVRDTGDAALASTYSRDFRQAGHCALSGGPDSIDVLLSGTAKGSSHVPGYQGFIPIAKNNPVATSHGRGSGTRDTWRKDNIVENYQRNVPGYTGHVPCSAVNEFGPKKPTTLTTTGSSYNL